MFLTLIHPKTLVSPKTSHVKTLRTEHFGVRKTGRQNRHPTTPGGLMEGQRSYDDEDNGIRAYRLHYDWGGIIVKILWEIDVH